MIFGKSVGLLSKFKRRNEIEWNRVGAQTVILDRREGELVRLNPFGSYLWDSFDGHKNLKHILESCVLEYEAPYETLYKDVTKFTKRLEDMELIQRVS